MTRLALCARRWSAGAARFVCAAGILLAGCQAEPAVDGAAGIGDSYYPELGNGGYDVTRYTLTLEIEPEANTLNGTATIEAQAELRLRTLHLDLEGLTVDSVEVGGLPADFTHAGRELTITPRQALARDRPFTLQVRYHGSPQPAENIASQVFDTVGWFHSASGAINVFAEPNGAATWFPANDHPRDKALYRFEITVPQPWVVAAPGTLRETTTSGGHTRFVFAMDQPMASYLASVNVDQYTVETLPGPDGIILHHYLPPGLDSWLMDGLAQLPAMLEFYRGLFGPYPFAEYGIVIAADDIEPCTNFVGGALELQTLSVHCPNSAMLSEAALAHELAHQWIGDSVSLENWQDLWLKEGLATYAEWLWLTRDRDLPGLTAYVRQERSFYSHDSAILQPPPDDIYDLEVYVGGATATHALRLQVGDEAFFRILREFADRYRLANASTADFIALSEEVSGQSLAAFFDAWLDQPTLPDLPGQPD